MTTRITTVKVSLLDTTIKELQEYKDRLATIELQIATLLKNPIFWNSQEEYLTALYEEKKETERLLRFYTIR